MARLAVCIHGMWGTPDVWRPWRAFLEARGWRVEAPALRHHEAPPTRAPAELGATSLNDYVTDLAAMIKALPERPVVIGHSMGGLIALRLCALGLASAGVLLTPAPPAGIFPIRLSNALAFQRIQRNWGWWRKPHRPTLAESLSYTFNTMVDRPQATALAGGFVHDSGRALFEIAFPWFDAGHAAAVDPSSVSVPLLFVAAGRDKLTPPGIVRRTARRFAHVAVYREYPGQGHWVLGQPGWQDVARDAANWLE